MSLPIPKLPSGKALPSLEGPSVTREGKGLSGHLRPQDPMCTCLRLGARVQPARCLPSSPTGLSPGCLHRCRENKAAD